MGPGCDSPGQVQQERCCPGRYDKTKSVLLSVPDVFAISGRPARVWLSVVPTSYVSYVYSHCETKGELVRPWTPIRTDISLPCHPDPHRTWRGRDFS